MQPSNGQFHEETPAVLSALVPTEHALSIQRAPEVVLEEARKAAKALADVLANKPKKVIISGEQYLQFEDWQTLGRFYGVTAAARTTEYVEFGDTEGFAATADALLVVNGQSIKISSAEAMCLNDEWKWQDKPFYQLKSMAQTRACAKALRNVLAWVVVLAGYQPTPAEEMDNEEKPQTVVPPRRKSVQSVSRSAAAAECRAVGENRQEPDTRKISDAQHNRLWAIARESTVLKTEVRELVQHFGFEDTKDITRDKYQMICARLFELGKE
jgi:ElaB/YqjD/DUF883 family membrane-anchored ribosome-binding protein